MDTIEETLKEVEDRQAKMHEARSKQLEHARAIVDGIMFEPPKHSTDRAKQAVRAVSGLFATFATELCMILPNDPRSSECLAYIENAAMWAQKAILVYDRQQLKGKQDANSNGNQAGSTERENPTEQ